MQPNPFNPVPEKDIKTRLRKNMQQKGKINSKVLAVLYEGFEQALNQENMVLSRSEKQRLAQQVIEQILTALIAENKELRDS